MLSLLSGTEIATLRDYLTRCVEGLERDNRREAAIPLPDCSAGKAAAPAKATAPGKATTARARAARRPPRRRGGTGSGTVRR
jgi:hypothetical protein